MQIFALLIYSVWSRTIAKARIGLCCPDRISLCPWKSTQHFTEESLCSTCLPLEENMCFFLYTETKIKRETWGWNKETNPTGWSLCCGAGVQGLAVTLLSKHCICIELIQALWRQSRVWVCCSCGLEHKCSLWKITSHHLRFNLS